MTGRRRAHGYTLLSRPGLWPSRPRPPRELMPMPSPISLSFLGTGNFHATAGYWNSFLIGDRILVEASPIVLRNLQLVGARLPDLDVVFISHFHADHTFGWPFLYYSSLVRGGRTSDLWVVGPPG